MRSGRLPEASVDACAARPLRAALTLTEPQDRPTSFDKAAHHALARRAAAESAVLLKNEGDLLPLKPGTRVALIGNFAFAPRYQGGGGTGLFQRWCTGTGTGKNALDLAKSADAIVYCFGLDERGESEGIDREHLRIPKNQIGLSEALARVNPHIVGVLSAGSVLEIPWLSYCSTAICTDRPVRALCGISLQEKSFLPDG